MPRPPLTTAPPPLAAPEPTAATAGAASPFSVAGAAAAAGGMLAPKRESISSSPPTVPAAAVAPKSPVMALPEMEPGAAGVATAGADAEDAKATSSCILSPFVAGTEVSACDSKSTADDVTEPATLEDSLPRRSTLPPPPPPPTDAAGLRDLPPKPRLAGSPEAVT